MEHRQFGGVVYLRVDKGEEIIASVLAACRAEGVQSAVFSGIGGCADAELQTFLPATGEFVTERVEGMLELIAISGNVVLGEGGKLYHHTHALFSCKEGEQHRVAAGHLKSSTVLYTAEIELRPVVGGTIRRRHDPETNTGFWDFAGA